MNKKNRAAGCNRGAEIGTLQMATLAQKPDEYNENPPGWIATRRVYAQRILNLQRLAAGRRIAGTHDAASIRSVGLALIACASFKGWTACDFEGDARAEARRLAVSVGMRDNRELDLLISDETDSPSGLTAAQTGQQVALTRAEWCGWNIAYIYPDVPEDDLPGMLDERRRERDRAAVTAKRRAKGMKPRATFVAGSVAEEARRKGVTPKTIHARRRAAKKQSDAQGYRCVGPLSIGNDTCVTFAFDDAKTLKTNDNISEKAKSGAPTIPAGVRASENAQRRASLIPELQRRNNLIRLFEAAATHWSPRRPNIETDAWPAVAAGAGLENSSTYRRASARP